MRLVVLLLPVLATACAGPPSAALPPAAGAAPTVTLGGDLRAFWGIRP